MCHGCDDCYHSNTIQVSVRAHGVSGETPFTFAGVAKQLKFHWTVSNMNIQSVSSVYIKVGVAGRCGYMYCCAL